MFTLCLLLQQHEACPYACENISKHCYVEAIMTDTCGHLGAAEQAKNLTKLSYKVAYYKVIMANFLANSCLFKHPAFADQQNINVMLSFWPPCFGPRSKNVF